MEYTNFFHKATGHEPYPYQRHLAEDTWPEILNIPTGLGKTAAVTLAWLWRRRENNKADLPRRLVWCLPMRVLVEQTYDNIRQWLKNLDIHGEPGDGQVSLHLLMGGEPSVRQAGWAQYPEEDAILIGTQDMLLSRALMRGYGMSRYQWPVHFALLHNDALWVFDEVQLMGPALATTSQLEAFRRNLETATPARSMWISATLHENWLDTVDFRPHQQQGLEHLKLAETDRSEQAVRRRIMASKHLDRAETRLQDKSKSGQEAYIRNLADEIREAHHSGDQTLVILNRVDRAQQLYDELAGGDTECLLLHARFRAGDRRNQEARLAREPGEEGRIIIATQAIEAGVDIDSRVMFTELAPWASLVQRFGRCNRAGLFDDAQIFWVDIDENEQVLTLPYEAQTLRTARTRLHSAASAAPADLPAVKEAPPVGQVLRRRDLLELFNTDPDLSGFDVDVSTYIRDTGMPQVQVFWRDVDSETAADQSSPSRDELCPVSLGQIREHLSKKLPAKLQRALKREYRQAWRFDALGNQRRGRWMPVSIDNIAPGQTIMLASSEGGYDPERGFVARGVSHVEAVIAHETGEQEGYGSEHLSQIGRRVTLDEHLHDVTADMETLADALELDERERDILVTADRWHDIGKAHEAFQRGLGFDPGAPEGPWAKSDHSGRPDYHTIGEGGEKQSRPGFRHELASMLAWIEHGDSERPALENDLIAYLIAAHHGRVRLGLRALPDEPAPPAVNGQDRLYARGVWEGDRLAALNAGGINLPEIDLRLDLMKLGRGPQGPSWSERTHCLLEHHGPFRLAWFEALVRIADWRASAREREK